MDAEPDRGRDAGRAFVRTPGEPISGRIGAGRARSTFGGFGLLVAALLVAAVVLLPNLRPGGPATSPTPGPATPEASVDGNPTASVASPSETAAATQRASAIADPTIVDRPGVPPRLYDNYWIVSGAWPDRGARVGQVGTTAQIVLPPSESVLGADAGRVASVAFDEKGEWLVSPGGLVTIVVRDIRTAKTLRTVETTVIASRGLLVGSLLFWTGWAIPLDPANQVDGGVWVIDLADLTSTPQAIIPAGGSLAPFGAPASRGPLAISPSGRTLVSAIVGTAADRTDVIDVPSLAVRAKFDGMGIATTDRATLVVRNASTSQPPASLSFVEIATGSEIGQVWQDLLQGSAPFQNTEILIYASVAGDGELFVAFPRDRDYVIAAVAEDTGRIRDILVQPDEALEIRPDLSGPGVLGLVPASGAILDPDGSLRFPVTLLDPATAILEPAAFTIEVR